MLELQTNHKLVAWEGWGSGVPPLSYKMWVRHTHKHTPTTHTPSGNNKSTCLFRLCDSVAIYMSVCLPKKHINSQGVCDGWAASHSHKYLLCVTVTIWRIHQETASIHCQIMGIEPAVCAVQTRKGLKDRFWLYMAHRIDAIFVFVLL